MEEKQLEELYGKCSSLINGSWEIEDPKAEHIIREQGCIIRDLITILIGYVNK